MINKNGYTLIELSISIAVIAILLTSSLGVFFNKQQINQINITQTRIKVIEQALKDFVISNHYLPCPALATAFSNDEKFGDSSGLYDSTYHLCLGGLSNNVGMIPVSNLNLTEDYAYDGWGRKFSYRIGKGLGSSDDFNNGNFQGDLKIVDLKGNEKTLINNLLPNNYGAAYVIISYGPSGLGAWPKDSLTAANLPNINSPAYQNTRHLTANFSNIYIQDNRTSIFDQLVSFDTKYGLMGPKLALSPFKLPNNVCNTASIITSKAWNNNLSLPDISGSVGGVNPSDLASQIYLSANNINKLCNLPKSLNRFNSKCSLNPLNIQADDLKLWLDGYDTSNDLTQNSSMSSRPVSYWVDKSGNNNAATSSTSSGSDPVTVNVTPFSRSKGAVYFNGDSYLNIDLSFLASSKYTIFIVEAVADYDQNRAILGSLQSALSYGSRIFSNSTVAPAITITDFYQPQKYMLSTSVKSNSHSYSSSIITARFNDIGNYLSVINNEGKVSEAKDNHQYFYLKFDQASSYIGSDGINNNYLGYIGEIIIYNQALSDETMKMIQSYLLNKWFSGQCQ